MGDLKPCPVKTCGSVNVIYHLDIPHGARVKCLSCGASGLETFPIRGTNGIETYDDLKYRVTKAWNTRAPTKDSQK